MISAAVADARETLFSTEVRHWFDGLAADSSGHAENAYPQLMRPIGLLDVTLARICELLVPELGTVLRTEPPAPEPPPALAVEPLPAPAVPLSTPAIALTAEDDLETWEESIGARFRDAVLAVDADFSPIELDVMLDVYAERFRLSRGRGTPVHRIVDLFPATTLAALVEMASVGLEHNAYWDAFWERLGVEHRSYDEAALRSKIGTVASTG